MSLYREAGDMYGDGVWEDVTKYGRRIFKQAQRSKAVRDFEKQAVDKGAKALRGIADSVTASTLGPGAALVADQALGKIQSKATDFLKEKIDQSGKGVRYMGAAGGGLRLSGAQTHVGRGLRLSGGAHGRGDGLRVAGHGLRTAGAAMFIPPGHVMRGSGHACACC